jgi:hypothetical protein
MNFKEGISIYDSDGNILEEELKDEGTFEFPMYYGAGFSVQYDRKLTICADYTFHDWSGTTQENNQFTYSNTNTFRAGVEYIPGRMNEYGFLGRMSYRAGYYHEDSYIVINNKAIADNGFSLGIGIPFLQNRTSINIAYNAGIKGTLDSGLIKANYHSLMLSLTLHDWWFIKRKFD